MQSKHTAEAWLGSCLYFQNADYCLNPAGLVFFSEHSGHVSPKVAPWRCDPWPSVGDPTRCGVCAGTVARGSSVSRGEALSPQTATESMARGVLSAPLSIILPPCLSLSARSLTFPFSLTLLFTLFPFFCCLSLCWILCQSMFFSLFLYCSAFFSLFFSLSSDVLFSTRSKNSPSSSVTFFVPFSSAHFHLPVLYPLICFTSAFLQSLCTL